MPRRKDTRARIIDLARSMLQERGFHRFSYKHLADALGIKTAAVHYHFPAKADLGTALVVHLRRDFQRWAAEIDSRGMAPSERLDAFFQLHGEMVDQGTASPFSMLEAEYGSLPDEMRREVRSLASEIHGWLARTLHQGVVDGEVDFPGDADEQAVVIGAAIQGAMHLARIFGPPAYRTAVAQLTKGMTPGG